jgi:hypothetical protein
MSRATAEREISSISLLCRDMRHAWRPVGDNVLVKKQGKVRTFSRVLECMRCETTRTDVYEITRTSVVRVHTKYGYPRGYHVKGGLPVGEARFMLFKDATMKRVP